MSFLDGIIGARSQPVTPFGGDSAQMRVPFVVELRTTDFERPTPDALARDILTQVGYGKEDIAAFKREQGFDPQKFLADGIAKNGIDRAAMVKNADHPNGAAQVSLLKGNLERLQSFISERQAAQTPTASAAERHGYNTADHTRAALEAKLPTRQPTPAAEPKKEDEGGGFLKGIGDFVEGAVAGDFSGKDSWSATAGKIIGGLNPVADARDIIAGGAHVIQGKEGAWVELGTSTLGAVPIVGDAGKALLRGGRKVAGEVAGEAAERAAKEAAERSAKEAAERTAGEAASAAIRSTPEMRQGFREMFGGTRYGEYAQEIDKVKAVRPELKDIPTEDLVAIRGYTSDDYRMLNSALRSGDEAELQRLDPYIKVATSGLSQLPPHKGTVFRGTTLNAEQAAKYEPGKVITEPPFTSSSLDADAAFAGNTKFKIDSVNGKEISILSEIPSEKEVLFAPGTQFKVLRVDVDSATGTRTINMREIPEGGK